MNIAYSRLYNQHIINTPHTDPSDVVRRLGAVQAQDYTGSLWAIGLRTAGATEAAVEQALSRRTIVRTWPMRGTLHIVPAEDVRWLLELLTPRVLAASAARHRQLELDSTVFARCTQLLVEALQGGKQLQRPAVYELLKGAGIRTHEGRGLHILSYLAQQRVICFGAREGRQHTFALLDEWVPETKRLHRDEALAELTLRYFSSHGPATIHDFAWWSGLTIADVRAGLELAGVRLASTRVSERTVWFAASSSNPERSTPDQPNALLLPAFDEYTVAYRDRSDVLSARHQRKAGAGGILDPTLVIDGQVAGTWKRALRKNSVVVTLAPFNTLSRADSHAVVQAAGRYAAFLGLTSVVE